MYAVGSATVSGRGWCPTWSNRGFILRHTTLMLYMLQWMMREISLGSAAAAARMPRLGPMCDFLGTHCRAYRIEPSWRVGAFQTPWVDAASLRTFVDRSRMFVAGTPETWQRPRDVVVLRVGRGSIFIVGLISTHPTK